MTLRSVLSDLGLLSDALADMRAHIDSRQNPAGLTKHNKSCWVMWKIFQWQLPLIFLANAVFVSTSRLMHLLTTWLYGCGSDAEEPNYPPKDALLSTYCNNVNKSGVYGNGQGGTYER